MKESSPKVARKKQGQNIGGLLWPTPVNSSGMAKSRSLIRWPWRSSSSFPAAKHHWSKAKGKQDSARAFSAAALHQQPRLGDLDKLARSTLDGCAVRSGGCLIADDSQVVSLALAKRYAERLEPTGAVIRLRTAP